MNSIPQNILVVQIGKLGDMILTTPLFKSIKDNYPHSNLIVIASQAGAKAAELCPYLDKILIYPATTFKRALFLAKVRALKTDLWIDPKDHYSRTSELLLKLRRRNVSLGFNHKKKLYKIDLREHIINKHYTGIMMSAANYLFNIRDIELPVLKLPNDFEKQFTDFRKKSYICCNISSGNKIRYWSKENWVELIKSLKDEKICLLIDRRDQKDADFIIRHTGIDLKYSDLFLKIAAIKYSRMLISPDTAMIHAAAAFNTNTIGLYGNNFYNITRFGPLSSNHKIIISKDSESLDSITSQEVYDAIINCGNAESRTRVRNEDH